ncbi:MAG: F420-0--gamma-glutamyl ligase [Clostridiales bacterium]|nr:F420-0--gamma-glutamyl ligase [Clostridiales bacterium]
MRTVGTVVRGIRAPIIKNGDDLIKIVIDSLISCAEGEGISLEDRDIVTITESVLARSQGNYASVDHIAKDLRSKLSTDTLGLCLPILSRNRFSILLRGIAMGVKKIYLQLSYPADEVGNHLFDADLLDEKGVNPWSDVLTEDSYREKFGHNPHPFTGVDYVDYYRKIIEDAGCEVEFIFSNDVRTILDYTKTVLCCDVHSRQRSRRLLEAAGAEKVLTLDNLLVSSVDGSGYNEEYGLLGSNKATEDSVKLFPRDSQPFVELVQKGLFEKTGKNIEVMVYGDGAFKDPVGGIWELADPVVSPGFTSGLSGTPNELKLKYLADNELSGLSGKELEEAMRERIRQKDSILKDSMEFLGTTPRRLTDLIGSLSDLTSGSGDKGTPIILIQGYFDSFAL